MYKSELLDSGSHLFHHQVVQFDGHQWAADDALLVYYVLEGECQVQYQQCAQQIHPQEIFFFPPNVPHTIYTEGSPVVYYCLSVTDTYFDSMAPELKGMGFDHFYVACNHSDRIYQELCHLISGVIYSLRANVRSSSLAQMTYVNQLVLFFYQEFHTEQVLGHSDYCAQRIQKILAFIQENYRKKLPLCTISREIGLHPQYFSAFFQKQFHTKYIDFLNRYRIHQSLQDLIHTDKNILEIALDHGFSNHKSYSNSFQRYCQMSPSAYRRKNRPGSKSLTERTPMGWLAPLYACYRQETVLAPRVSEQLLSVQMDIRASRPVAVDRRIQSIGIGSGYYLLQDQVYEQLKRVARECAFTHVHFRDVFCDMMNVYTEPQPDHPLYYWESLDLVLERILGLGFCPYIEIGYTPRELASSANMLGFSYHPYTGVPSSLSKYCALVRAFLQHCIQRYGMDSMKNWRFDFWNSANLQSSNGFWDGTQEEFFRFYRTVYRVFREVDPELKLGSPNFSLPDGISWYEAFFEMCCQKQIAPDFISIHLYSCFDDLAHFSGIFPYPPMTYNYLSLTNTDYLKNIIGFLKDVMRKYGFDHLPLLAGEWNITYYLQDLTRDTAFMAAYIAHSQLQMIGLLEGSSFFCLSDVNDQTRPSKMIFPGSSGLISRHGIVKPAYYAFYLLHKLDPDIIYLKPPCIITRSENGFHVLVYNISDYRKSGQGGQLEFLSDKRRYQVFHSTDPIAFHGSFSVPCGDYSIKTYLMDQEHGSPYDTWLRMGAPEPLNDETITALLHASFLYVHYDRQEHTDVISLEAKVKVHGILMFEIRHILDESCSPESR